LGFSIDHYGGSIKTPDFFLGFSGLTERADEASLAKRAFKLGMLSATDLEAIKQISGNRLIAI